MEHFKKWRQLMYANGHMGFSILDNIYGAYLVFFLLPPKETGMAELVDNRPLFWGITIVGLINIFGRIIDSVADPFIAWWSDNAKFKLGRRKFFMMTGALPFALCAMALFFQPSTQAGMSNAIYTALVLGLYFFFYTYYMSPNLALIPELSRNASERIKITVYQAVFSLLGAAIVLIIAPIIRNLFEGAGLTITRSFQVTIVILAAFSFISMILSGIPVNEKRFSRSKASSVGLIESLKMTLSNRSFIIYMIGIILYWFSFNMVRSVIAYYPVVLLNRDSGYQTILMGVLLGTAFLLFCFLPWLNRHFTNKQLMLSGMVSFAIIQCVSIVLPYLGGAASVVAVVQMVIMGYPVAILLVIPNTIVSDLSELDGYKRGINREAMFFGTQGFFMKVNYGIALAISAGLFAVFGKDADSPLGVALTGPVGAVFIILGIFVFLKFPQKEVTAELQRHRDQLA